MTNCHKLGGLRQYSFIGSQSIGQKFRLHYWVLCSEYCKTEIKVLTRLNSHLEALGEHSLESTFCWNNSVSCNRKVPISLLTVDQDQKLLYSYPCDPLHLQIRNGASNNFLYYGSFKSSSPFSLAFKHIFKGSMWLGQAHLDNLLLINQKSMD